MTFHKLLERQLRKFQITDFSDNLQLVAFLNAISESYHAFDRDVSLGSHAFEIAEKEYQTINNLLKTESKLKEKTIEKLQLVLDSLEKDGKINRNSTNILDVADYINELVTKLKESKNELQLAKEEAEKANKAKSEFLSVISHEIRSPLNAIIGITHLLIRQNPNPEQLENLQVLKSSSENLKNLINDLLDLSKIEAGKLEIDEVEFSLKNLMNEIKTMHLLKAQEKGLKLKLFLDGELPELVLGDQLRLSQVLINLVSNAIKFTEQGEVIVSVELLSEDVEKCTIEFSVRDTGIGIPEEKQAQIFDSFTQASSGITRQFGGTGLGLSISKKLLMLMKSEIKLQSKPNEGSTFSFSLAFQKCSNEIIPVQSSVVNHENSFHGKKILLVEDLPFNILYAKQLLESWGIEVDTAENGKIGAEKAGTDSFDLILMDLQMPVMDGENSAKTIRANGIQTKIVALTASATEEVKDRVLKAGMQDYLSKPISPAELNRKLTAYFK